jgi:hypothetical protein
MMPPRKEIRPHGAWPLSAFKAASGLGDKALREARRAGLRVVRCHGKAFVRADDFLAYLDRLAEEQRDEQPAEPEPATTSC